jgi:iron complex outermembrane receptor protein
MQINLEQLDKRPSDVSKLVKQTQIGKKAIYRNTDFVDNNISMWNLFNTIPTRLTVGNTYQEGLLTNVFNRNTVVLSKPFILKDHLRIKIECKLL